jgi:putative DNA primase/helicase
MSETNGQFVIECGPPGSDGKRIVTARFGKQQHRDKFDVDDSFRRSKFRERLISHFQLTDDAHEHLESKILAAASATSVVLAECSIVRLSDVQPEQVEWLWHERIAIGKLTLVVGDPGLGKSFVTLDMAARVSRGAPWPDKPGVKQPAGDVILLGAEDDLADTVRPRLDAHEADVSRIIAIKGTKFADEADDQERMVNLATDLDSIRRVIQSANNPRAIIIDPVSAYLGKTDSHKNAEVRAVLSPLATLAAELRVAVIAVSHLRKGEGQALYRTMGSLAFIAAARSAWVVCQDAADPKRRLLLPLKSNIAPDVGGLAFAIMPHGFDSQPVLCWEASAVTTAADDAIGHGRRKHGPEPSEREDAAGWLREQLAEGPRPKPEIVAEGDGYGYSERTLRRAFKDIGGASKVSGFPAVAVWSLSLANGNGHISNGQPGQPGPTEVIPEEEEETTKFLSNTDTVRPSSECQGRLAEFEAERIELSNGNGHGEPVF